MYNYVLGGQTHFEADRQLAAQMGSVLPGGLDFGRALAKRNRAFMTRAVRYLVAEAGVRQLLDIGAGIPAYDNTHETAQEIAPESRIVYVDHDPIVLAHAHQLVRSTPEGACAYVHADVHDVDEILEASTDTLDLTEPVGLLLIAILCLVNEDGDSYETVSHLIDALPSGSYLAISHFTADIVGDEMTRMAEIYRQAGRPMSLRSQPDVSRFFDDLELVEPGVVLLEDWRPDGPPHDPLPTFVGVGRKR